MKNTLTVFPVIMGLLILGLGFPLIYAPSFVGLGDLPGGSFVSTSEGISPEGTSAVGASFSASGLEAFRWTEENGMVGLGDLPGGRFESFSLDTSSDGVVVVGQGNSASGSEAFRWTEGTGMVGLGDLPGGSFSSRAWGISADGSVVVGQGRSALGSEAFRWTQGTGMVGLGDLPGGSFVSVARDVSADGSVVVGFGRSGLSPQAFRWTEGTGMVGIGFLPGGLPNSVAQGVSADGNVIVGYGRLPIGFEAFRWTSGTGMVGLGDLPGGSFTSQASAASADGSVIVGFSNSGDGNVAFVWDSVNGMRDLKMVLTDAGIDLTGITLTSANDVSDDGCIIVGTSRDVSFNFEAYRVDLCTLDVKIDIKPGSDTNTIQPFNMGVITVVVSSSSTFSAESVDFSTVTFGPNEATPVHKKPHFADVIHDGLDDMILHFKTKEIGVDPSTVDLCLMAKTLDGTSIEGCDSIRVVPEQ